MVVSIACEPIVDRQELENTVSIEDVQLVATQATEGGNMITLEMASPEVNGYWDYNLGRTVNSEISFIYPIPGTATFTYVGSLGAEFFEKTVEVQIDILDHELDQDWYDLVSENTSEGKTWVFAGEGGDEGLWWFMSANDNPDGHMGSWWNAGGTCCPPEDVDGRMEFDLDGAANFTYYAGPDAAPVVGSFVLDVANQTLAVDGADILGAPDDYKSPNGVYQIMSLTEDELILYVPMNAGGTGWTWVFRPEQAESVE